MNLIRLYRIGNFLHRNHVPILPTWVRYLIFLLYNSDVPSSVVIGEGTLFSHSGIGVVIHERAVIGDACTIGQNCTIGGRSKHHEVPVIGSNVYMGAGSRVFGPIVIGDNVVIAPNAVVIEDVKSNCIVGGVPARVIRDEISIDDYV